MQICQKGAFLAGASNTAIELYFTQKLSTGFFGGEVRGITVLVSSVICSLYQAHPILSHVVTHCFIVQGFILQRLVGDGLVLLKGGGATIIRELQPGESLRVRVIAVRPRCLIIAKCYSLTLVLLGGNGLHHSVPDVGAL